jgi:hypothetical protein
MKRLVQDKLALLIVPVGLLFSAPAFGQADGCAADADCAEGQICQKGMVVDPCFAPPSDGSGEDVPACDSEPHESETGYCYTPPTPCESDADCDEYLSCAVTAGTDCAVSSDGSMTCPTVEPVKYCSIGSVSCTTDDECPREFECVETMTCLLIACAEGETDCPDPCAPSGEKQCQPKEIECAETADCPSDWSCAGNYIESCSGGTSSGPGTEPGSDDAPSAGGAATGGPTTDAPPDEVTCTREPAAGVCQPNAWNGESIAYSDDILEVGAEGDGAANPTAAPPGDDDSGNVRAGGGCSVARGHQPLDFTWVLGLLLALPLIRRRSVA